MDTEMSVACTLVACVTNVLVAIYFRKRQHWAVGSAIIAGLLLLILGNSLVKEREDRLSSRILGLFGIGYGQEATLILKPEGVNALQGSLLKDKSTNVVTAEILSRLGPEFFLGKKQSSGQKKEQYLYVSLPKSMVLSWSVRDKDVPEEKPDRVESTALAKNRQRAGTTDAGSP